MPARPGVLPALRRSRVVTSRKSVMVKRDRSLCPASVRAVCWPLLLSCAAAEASGVCHRPGDSRNRKHAKFTDSNSVHPVSAPALAAAAAALPPVALRHQLSPFSRRTT